MSKVAVIPLAKFTSEADHKLVADLATSVERNATLKMLREMADRQHGFARGVLLTAITRIEKSEHV